MEKKKILQDIPAIMKPMPRFKHIKLHEDYKYDYYIYPITKNKVELIRSNFLIDDPFSITVDKFIVDGSDIVVFGASNDIDYSMENKLGKLIVSKGGVLSVPHPIDKKNLLVGNKMIPGVPAIRIYEHKLCLLGNPANVIIFRIYNLKRKR